MPEKTGHHMMTSSNGNIFHVTGPLCGEFTGPGEFPTQRPVTRSFDVFFDLRLNKRLSKQWWGWWFETLSCPLWRHCNDRGVSPLEIPRDDSQMEEVRLFDPWKYDYASFVILNWSTFAINSLLPSDARWRQISGSTLAQVMACFLTGPSHYLNQCWLIISEVQWYWMSPFKFPRGQWVYHTLETFFTGNKTIMVFFTLLGCLIKWFS